MTTVDALGYFAAGLVLATFCAKRMVPLRAIAIASNIAFVAYAFFAGLGPILLLHSVMLPLNLMRLREALGRGAQPATNEERGELDHRIAGSHPQYLYPRVLNGVVARLAWPISCRVLSYFQHGIWRGTTALSAKLKRPYSDGGAR